MVAMKNTLDQGRGLGIPDVTIIVLGIFRALRLGSLTSRHIVYTGADCVNVSCCRSRGTLWRLVLGCTTKVLMRIHLIRGHAKVGYLNVVEEDAKGGKINEQVLWFEVPVQDRQDIVVVQMVQTLSDLDKCVPNKSLGHFAAEYSKPAEK